MLLALLDLSAQCSAYLLWLLAAQQVASIVVLGIADGPSLVCSPMAWALVRASFVPNTHCIAIELAAERLVCLLKLCRTSYGSDVRSSVASAVSSKLAVSVVYRFSSVLFVEWTVVIA